MTVLKDESPEVESMEVRRKAEERLCGLDSSQCELQEMGED